ncbi:MAG: hypothetical protein HYT80_01205 [Euryarchaeota archaeon]|nr:hypothetical protein [Euryarchaeota archaeon]
MIAHGWVNNNWGSYFNTPASGTCIGEYTSTGVGYFTDGTGSWGVADAGTANEHMRGRCTKGTVTGGWDGT